jgi:MarR family transcriptional regulator, negative regulator of the multidrug operon emrRAB
MHAFMDRLANLLGVTALVAADRMRIASRDAALVHLQAWPGGSIEDLRRVLRLSQPAAVRLVDRLAADGLLERRAGRDARTRSLQLTPAGDAEAGAVLDRRGEALEALLAPLAEDERARLTPLLERLVSTLAHDRPGALTTCRLCDRGACTSGPGCPLEHTA